MSSSHQILKFITSSENKYTKNRILQNHNNGVGFCNMSYTRRIFLIFALFKSPWKCEKNGTIGINWMPKKTINPIKKCWLTENPWWIPVILTKNVRRGAAWTGACTRARPVWLRWAGRCTWSRGWHRWGYPGDANGYPTSCNDITHINKFCFFWKNGGYFDISILIINCEYLSTFW